MPSVLDDTGLTIATQDELSAAVRQRLWDRISTELDLSAESPLGEIVDAFTSQARQVLELVQASYAARAPSQATGQALRDLAEITGTIAEPATKSYVPCEVDLTAGTYPAGTLIAHVASDPTKRFVNRDEIVSPGGTVTGQVFEAEETGPVVVNLSTLTVMAVSVSGWTRVENTAGTGGAGAYLGTDAEGTAALRLRREDELARRGSTNVDAIRTDLLDVSGVTNVTVLMNVGDVVDGNGLPPHSVAAYVQGGTDADVAAALFATVAAGIKTHGSTTVNVQDSQGLQWPISFTRPTAVPIYMSIVLTGKLGEYVGNTAVRDALVSYGDALGVGRDVIYVQLLRIIAGLGGVIDVPLLEIGTSPGPALLTNIVIGVNQYPDFDTGNITIIENLVAGPP